MEVRDAALSDMEQITVIYNDVLLSSTSIYNDRPASVEDRIAWLEGRHRQGYPVLVAVEGDTVLGFASYGDFRTWPGYRFTVEGTIHISSTFRKQGVGSVLLARLIDHARAAGKHILIAGVDSGNAASLKFLERSGFERAGCLREVGYKFGHYLDLVLLQYWLTAPERSSENAM